MQNLDFFLMWMEVTMISRGVEISIAGGVAETEDV